MSRYRVSMANPFVRNVPCPACGQIVRIIPLAFYGHERLRCASCNSLVRVRYLVSSFILTFVVLTLIYGLVWLVPWEKNPIGITFLVGLLVVGPLLISWALGRSIAIEKAPEI